MNKEEMKRRLEENVEPKYNKQRNLEEIKSNLTFTNEKEIMESMVQEKQQQTKRFRWITTLSIIFACVLLIGTNWMTYTNTLKKIPDKYNIKVQKTILVENYFEENNLADFSYFPNFTLYIEEDYEFSLYQGEKNNQLIYVYYIGILFIKQENKLNLNITNEDNQSITISKNLSERYAIGELNLEDLTQGSQLTIDIYENDNFLEQRIITL